MSCFTKVFAAKARHLDSVHNQTSNWLYQDHAMLLNSLLSRLLLTATVSVLSACAMNANTTSASDTATTDASATASPAANTLSAYHWDLTDARDAKGTVQTNWVPPKT